MQLKVRKLLRMAYVDYIYVLTSRRVDYRTLHLAQPAPLQIDGSIYKISVADAVLRAINWCDEQNRRAQLAEYHKFDFVHEVEVIACNFCL